MDQPVDQQVLVSAQKQPSQKRGVNMPKALHEKLKREARKAKRAQKK